MIKYKLIHPKAKFGVENRKTSGSVGYDLYTVEDVTIPWQGAAKARTGVCLDMSNKEILSYYAEIVPRSSLYFKHSVIMANSVGIIDSDYQGELLIPLIYVNHAPGDEVTIPAGTAIAQLIFNVVITPKIEEVEEFKNKTQRGDGGFGSTDLVDFANAIQRAKEEVFKEVPRPIEVKNNFFPLGLGFAPFPFLGPFG